MITTIKTIIDIFKNLLDLFKNHGTKTILYLLIIIFISVITSISTSIIINKNLNKNFEKIVEKVDTKKDTNTKKDYYKSLNTYSKIKTYLKKSYKEIGCNYILMLEFHDGDKGISSNLHFCKFSISLEVGDNYVDISRNNNENISQYDLFLNDENIINDFNKYTLDSINNIDPRLYYILKDFDCEYVYTYNMHTNNYLSGLLIFLSKEDIIKYELLSRTTKHIENILENN